MQKDIELCLEENFEDKNYLIKELFNKCNNMENEIIQLKNNNYLLNEENKKLKEENMNIKNEIQLYQNNTMNSIMNSFNSINEIKMTVNQIQQKNNMNLMNNQQMMPMNNQQMMSNPLLNKKIKKEENDICVIFQFGNDSLQRHSIYCKPNDLVSDIIKKLKKKINFKFDEESYKFIFNATIINKTLTVEEEGLFDDATIFVQPKKGVMGG